MKQAPFRTPKTMDKLETFNKCVATGIVAKYQDKTKTYEYLDEYTKKDNTPYYMFLMGLKVNGSTFKVRGLNSVKVPNRTKELADIVEDDMTVTVEGSFIENYNMEKDRTYRETMAWSIKPVNSTDEHKVAVTLKGRVGVINKVDDSLEFTMILPSNNPSYDDAVFRIFAAKDNQYTKWMLDTNVAPNDWMQVNCYYNSQFEKDDFGNIITAINQNELYSITSFAKNMDDNTGISLDDLPF